MNPWEYASARPILAALAEVAGEAYLVGGMVRDALVGRSWSKDIDVAVRGDGYRIAQDLAKGWGPNATFVALDRARGTGRVVLGKGAVGVVDLSSFKGDSIEEDLRARDFTINAIAIGVRDLVQSGTVRVLDPTGGRDDLASGRIRACSPSSFLDDPLRVLRAFRLKALLGFELDESTMELLDGALRLLPGVAGERMRDELFMILNTDNCSPVLADMNRKQVLGTLFPELIPMKGVEQNPFHHLDVWDHSLESVRQLEILLEHGAGAFEELGPTIREYMDKDVVPGRSRRALLKLALLFHDAGKPECAFTDENNRMRFFGHEKVSKLIFLQAGERLKLAVRELRLVGEWIAGHMRPTIFTGKSVSNRAVLRLHRRFGEDLPGLLVIFLADLAASRGPDRRPGEQEQAFQQVCSTLKAWKDYSENPRQRLVNGNDIMEVLGLQAGPMVGRILDQLAELEVSGEVRSREQALEAARKIAERSGLGEVPTQIEE